MIKKITTSLVVSILLSGNIYAAGKANNGKVSAYLEGALQSVSAVEGALGGAGFEVLGKDVNGDLTTIVFTCTTLKKLGSTPNRGFASVLRVLVDNADGIISITNPLYFEHAFLQADYDEGASTKILAKLNSAFAGLKDSKDSLKSTKLGHYHFMMGMPYYEDMQTVGKGDNASLIAKAQASGKALFTLNLGNNQTLIGFDLDDDVASFVGTIGKKNGSVLPYTVLIEGGKAKILAAKYDIALSYPSLKMGQFMQISATPGKIEENIASAFK
jgi:hypothetical protein